MYFVWNAFVIGDIHMLVIPMQSFLDGWLIEQVRKCPICKATSFYVIPSNFPIFDPEVKQRLIETYKENMSSNNKI